MEVQWEAVKLITYLKRYNWELVKTPKRKINETFKQTLKFSETRSIVRQCIQFNLFKVFSTTQIKCVGINPKTAASTIITIIRQFQTYSNRGATRSVAVRVVKIRQYTLRTVIYINLGLFTENNRKWTF